MKTKDISGLERNQGRNFLIGFALSLTFVWMAFEWTVGDPEPVRFAGEASGIVDEIQVLRTAHPRQQSVPPPRSIRPSDRIEPIEEPSYSTEPSMVDTAIQVAAKGPVAVGLPVVSTPPPLPKPRVEEVEAPLVISEIMPRFPGCEEPGLSKEERRLCAERKLLEFIYKNLDYPALARENGIEGKVLVQFVVEKDGSITQAQVVRDIGGGCGQAVLRVLGEMPRWIPGSQQGRKVRVLFSLPVRFEMNRF
jgi:protein TonB